MPQHTRGGDAHQARKKFPPKRLHPSLPLCSRAWHSPPMRSHGADYAMPNLLDISPHQVAAGSALIGIAAACTTSSRSRAGGNGAVANERSTRRPRREVAWSGAPRVY